MEQKMMEVTLGRSKRGLATIWEWGGATTSAGSAQIIVGKAGEPLIPLYLPAPICNGDHALFVAYKGVYVVRASHHRDDVVVQVAQFPETPTVSSDSEKATIPIVAEYSRGEWGEEGLQVVDRIKHAIDVALVKCRAYHCREAMYFRQKEASHVEGK